MEPDEYEDLIDDSLDDYDSAQDLQEGQIEQFEAGTFPMQKDKSDQYNWFWRVVRLAKADRLIRVGNLDKNEIGNANVSIRDGMNLAQLGKIFGHKKFGEYWENLSATTSASSMAKKGWLIESSISQKRVRGREKKSEWTPDKKRMFSKSPEKQE